MGETTTRVFLLWFAFPPVRPCLRFSPPVLPFERCDGPCGPRFLPRRGETIRPERHPHHHERHLAEPVTPGCTRAGSPFVIHRFPTTANGELSNGLQLQICNNGLHKMHQDASTLDTCPYLIHGLTTFSFAFASFDIKSPAVGLIPTSWVFVLV